MKVYLVRHGKSEEDFNGKRQMPTSVLAPVGIEQAEKAAEKLLGKKFHHVYASHWHRAKQTAEIITEKIEHELDIHPHIHEVEGPDELYGSVKDGELDRQFNKELAENFDNPDWKFLGGGESLNEVLVRAKKFRDELIEKHPDDDVLVVSHGVFIACLLSTMIWGDRVPVKEVRAFVMSLNFENTSVSIVNYNPQTGFWKIESLNDHTHLD